MLIQIKVGLICAIIIVLLIASVAIATFFLIREFQNNDKTDAANYSDTNGLENKGCRIYPFEVDLHPIVVISETNNFLYPERGEKLLKFAAQQSLDFSCPGGTVKFGVHGVTTLPHEAVKKSVELYLFVNQSSHRKALPVPDIFWKVAYNPVTKRGIPLIGLNNPYKSTFVTICNDISSRLSWLHWKRENQRMGFCYACRINTFRKVVTIMPYIPDNGILL